MELRVAERIGLLSECSRLTDSAVREPITCADTEHLLGVRCVFVGPRSSLPAQFLQLVFPLRRHAIVHLLADLALGEA